MTAPIRRRGRGPGGHDAFGSFGLTRRGWTLAGSAAGLLVGGRVLGADELSVLGLAALLLLAGALAWVLAAPPGITVTRRVDPARVHVGDAGRVDLAVTPPIRRASPLVHLTDLIDRGRLRARFVVAPLAPTTSAAPAYRLPTERRGAVTLGPATATRTDPFGLARRARTVAATTTALIRPRVFAIDASALGAGRRMAPDHTEGARAQSPDAGGEFLAVRPYEDGDDPRHVHWRSSARADGLMVRQYVAPRRGRTLVLLDTRAHAGTVPREPGAEDPPLDAPFERALEAAASVVVWVQRTRRPVECRTTSGATLTSAGGDPTHRVLDRLAVVHRDEDDLLAALADERLRPAPELIVLVTAAYDAAVHHALARFAARAATVVVVTGGETPSPTHSVRVVDARTDPFPIAWSRVAHAPRARAAPPWTSAAASPLRSRSPR